jgi:hypothetical protein
MGHPLLLPEDPWAELRAVEAEVAAASAALATLVHKMHALKARVNNIYSPFVRLLPPEVVSEVFTYFNPSFSAGDDDIHSSCAGHNPLLLGAVCSAWREIAWSTPSLWATLTLHITSPSRIPAQIQLIEQWLGRSGSLPLSIRLSACTSMSWLGATPEGIIMAINQFSSRWANLDIRFPSQCYKYLPRTGEGGVRLPFLQSVSLKPPGGQSDREHRIFMQDAPRLRHLNLSCLYLRSITFNWESVTSMDLESFYIDESLGMLLGAPALIDLTLRRTLGGDDRHTLPFDSVHLASLQSITIINDKGTEMQTLLNKIVAPQLRKIVYAGEGVLPAPSTELLALIVRSNCAIEELSLTRASIREEALLALFSVMPSLIALTLVMPPGHSVHHTPLTDRILTMCNPDYTNANELACQLPLLKKLAYSGPQGFSWELFRTLLDARIPPFARGDGRLCSSAREISVSCISDIQLSIAFSSRVDALKQLPHTPDASTIKSYRSAGINLSFYSTIPEEDVDPFS